MGMARSSITNRDRSSFLMISSWTNVLTLFNQLDSRCRAPGLPAPVPRGGVSILPTGTRAASGSFEERNFLKAAVFYLNLWLRWEWRSAGECTSRGLGERAGKRAGGVPESRCAWGNVHGNGFAA